MRIKLNPKVNLTGFENLSGSLLKFLEVIKSSFLMLENGLMD
jgi:hypothetical protein